MNKKDLYIITGGSKGLGLALVDYALLQDHFVISIARTMSRFKHENLIQIKHDLSKNYESIEKKLNQFFKSSDFKKIRHIYFINNAAQIQPVASVGNLDIKSIEKHISLNYTMPVLLTNWFMAQKTKNTGTNVIVQISSGAAGFAITNWSMYCSSKAAIEMFNSVMQIQIANSKKIKAITYSPGIIDTDMQATIRSLKTKDFPEVERFKTYKKTNELRKPEDVAKLLMKLISQPNKLTEKSYSL